MSQKLDTHDLSGNSTNEGGDILSEYKKTTNAEVRQDSSLSGQDAQTKAGAKAGEINNDKKNIDENIANTKKGSPNLGGGNGSLIEIIFTVLMAAIKAAQEDIKKYAGKIKQVDKEANRTGGESQEKLTSSLMAHVNVFGIKVELSRVGKFFTSLVVVLLITGVVIAVVVVGQKSLDPNVEISSSDPVEQKPPENNPLEIVLITPDSQSRSENPLELVLVTPSISECSIHFTSPVGTAKLNNFGPVLFEWTDVPAASSYILKVAPPEEASLPWGYAVQENSKNIYMENFPMGGEFSISVHALSSSGTVLCSTTLRYTKDEYAKQSGGNLNNEGQGDQSSSGGEPASTPCVTTGIGYFCP